MHRGEAVGGIFSQPKQVSSVYSLMMCQQISRKCNLADDTVKLKRYPCKFMFSDTLGMETILQPCDRDP